MNPYPVPLRESRAEIRIANSRFIASLAPAFSVEQARAFIDRIRNEFSDASSHVPAFVIGHGASLITHCNDGGEPSGTAGRPALSVLQGSGLGDVVVVISRYFGGTKLGTGGLVRAFSEAVRQVLAVTPRAQKTTTHTVRMTVPYDLFERSRLLIEGHGGEVLDESFAVEVSISARFAESRWPDFQAGLQELSRGQIEAQVIDTNSDSLLPLPPSV
ncbi:MAG TPA: YigZ family protein [Paracoccaceae bacterium]